MPRREFRATVDTRSSVADRTDDASMRLTLLLFRRVAAESPALINAHAHDDDAHDDADDLHHLRVPLPNRGEQIAQRLDERGWMNVVNVVWIKVSHARSLLGIWVAFFQGCHQ